MEEENANKKDETKKQPEQHRDAHNSTPPYKKIEHAWPQELTGLMLLMKCLYIITSVLIFKYVPPENPNFFHKAIDKIMSFFVFLLIGDVAVNAVIFFGRICPFFIVACFSLLVKNGIIMMIFIADFIRLEMNYSLQLFLYVCTVYIVDALFIHYLRHHLKTPDKCVKRNYEYDSEDIQL